MARTARGAIATVTVGACDSAEILPEPREVAHECCEWGARRMNQMQPKWFNRHDAYVGHTVRGSCFHKSWSWVG